MNIILYTFLDFFGLAPRRSTPVKTVVTEPTDNVVITEITPTVDPVVIAPTDNIVTTEIVPTVESAVEKEVKLTPKHTRKRRTVTETVGDTFNSTVAKLSKKP